MSAEDLPAPLTSADVDLRDFPYTPLFRARLFGSNFHAHADDASWRAGVTLWLKSWDQVPAGTLPDDDVVLCRLAELGRDIEAWRAVKEWALHGWIKCSDGRLHHPVVADGINEAWESKCEKRQRARAASLAASLARQQKKPAADHHGDRDGDHHGDRHGERNDSVAVPSRTRDADRDGTQEKRREEKIEEHCPPTSDNVREAVDSESPIRVAPEPHDDGKPSAASVAAPAPREPTAPGPRDRTTRHGLHHDRRGEPWPQMTPPDVPSEWRAKTGDPRFLGDAFWPRGPVVPIEWRVEEAQARFPAVDRRLREEWADREALAYQLYWTEGKGAGVCRPDWRATWRNWMQRARPPPELARVAATTAAR